MPEFKNYPLEECAAGAKRLIAQGATIYQKWTCEKCGDRVTANNPNTFTTKGHHEDCGHVTDITKTGCNYLATLAIQQPNKGVTNMQPLKIPNKSIVLTAEDIFTLFYALFLLDEGEEKQRKEIIHTTVQFLGAILKNNGIDPITGTVARGPSAVQ